MNKLKRYVIFLVGLFFSSMGVSLVTKASLGTSPISSIPYVLSLNFPFTLGNFTILFSVFLIVLQVLILRKNFKLEHLLQLPVSVLFGYFIDWTMLLFTFVQPHSYISKIMYLLLGCVILAFGVYLEVLANVVMLPGESFVRAVVDTWHRDFGTTKVVFDVTMAVVAIALSLLFAGKVDGVREGTLIAAFLVGFVARLMGRALEGLKPRIFPEEYDETGHLKSENTLEENTEGADTVLSNTGTAVLHKEIDVITIGREFGSGGHELGKMLAEQLGYAFYDEEIIQMTAGTTGYTPEFIGKNEEMMTNSLIYDLVNNMYNYSTEYDTPKDKIFEAEEKVITKVAQKGKCVIVGRCADYMLKNQKNCLRVFLKAPLESRVKRVMKRDGLSEYQAKTKIQKEDHQRAYNYRYYTKQTWGAAANYQVILDTDFGYQQVIDIIKQLMKNVGDN